MPVSLRQLLVPPWCRRCHALLVLSKLHRLLLHTLVTEVLNKNAFMEIACDKAVSIASGHEA